MSEHEDLPIRGLPERLPDGETILWQGSPRWESFARRAVHARKLMLYFGVLICWDVASRLSAGAGVNETALSAIRFAGLALVVIALVMTFAWLVGRTTIYTVTTRRVVVSFGIALPMTVNIPIRKIESAGLRAFPDGTGDILLSLLPGERLSYLVLWPHVRPWRFARVQPMLRTIPDAVAVAQILARAAATIAPAQVSLGTPVGADTQGADTPGATAGPHIAAAA